MGTIDDFRGQLSNMAAPNRFEVLMAFPAFPGIPQNMPDVCKFMIKAATVPAESIGQIEVPYHGMTLKLSGDRTYEDWTVTVYNSETWDVRTAFENWMRYIHDPVTSLKTNHNDYQVDLNVQQLGITTLDSATPIAKYMIHNAWPKDMSEIELDFESNDTIETFTVTLAYNYFIRV